MMAFPSRSTGILDFLHNTTVNFALDGASALGYGTDTHLSVNFNGRQGSQGSSRRDPATCGRMAGRSPNNCSFRSTQSLALAARRLSLLRETVPWASCT